MGLNRHVDDGQWCDLDMGMKTKLGQAPFDTAETQMALYS